MHHLIRLKTSLTLFVTIEILLLYLLIKYNLNLDYYILYTILNIVFIFNVYFAKFNQNVFHFILHLNYVIYYLLPSLLSIFLTNRSYYNSISGINPDEYLYFEAYIYGTTIYVITNAILFCVPKFKINTICYRSTKLLMIVHYTMLAINYFALYISDGWGQSQINIIKNTLMRFLPASTLYFLLIIALAQKQKKVAIYAIIPAIPLMFSSKSAVFGMLVFIIIFLLLYNKNVLKFHAAYYKRNVIIIIMIMSGFYLGTLGRQYLQTNTISFVNSNNYFNNILFRTSIPDTIALIKHSIDVKNPYYKDDLKDEMYSIEFQLKNVANAYVIGEVFDLTQPLFNSFPMIYLNYNLDRILKWYHSWHQSLEGYLLAKYESYTIGVILTPFYIYIFSLFIVSISYIFKNYQLYALTFLIYYTFKGYVNFFSIEMTLTNIFGQIYNMFLLILILELTYLPKYYVRLQSSMNNIYSRYDIFKNCFTKVLNKGT